MIFAKYSIVDVWQDSEYNFAVVILEVVYVTIGNRAFCVVLYLTGAHFWGELQHTGHVGGQKMKCRPMRTQEIGGVRLQDELYDYLQYF